MQAGLEQRTLEECIEVEQALVSLINKAASLVPKSEKQRKRATTGEGGLGSEQAAEAGMIDLLLSVC